MHVDEEGEEGADHEEEVGEVWLVALLKKYETSGDRASWQMLEPLCRARRQSQWDWNRERTEKKPERDMHSELTN